MSGEWLQFPRCPKCQLDDQDWWDGVDKQVGDGTELAMSCAGCGTEYTATACLDVTFLSTLPEGESE